MTLGAGQIKPDWAKLAPGEERYGLACGPADDRGVSLGPDGRLVE